MEECTRRAEGSRKVPLFTLEEILPVLPHRPPFLFVDRVMELDPDRSILAERELRADEPQFAGHFPGRPIMPGVLVAEALAQTSGLLLGLSNKLRADLPPSQPRTFYLATTSLKYTAPARPGDVLVLKSVCEQQFSALTRFHVEASVGARLIAKGSLTLALVEGEPPV